MSSKTKAVLAWTWIALMAATAVFFTVKIVEMWRTNRLTDPVLEKYKTTVEEFVKIRQEINEEPVLTEEDFKKLDNLKSRMNLVREYLNAAGEILEKAMETGDEKQFQMANAFIDKANEDLKAIKEELERYKKLNCASRQ